MCECVCEKERERERDREKERERTLEDVEGGGLVRFRTHIIKKSKY